ncbi:GNAT family N-acetyltransferase [Aquimarina pacifica]|uniref:GNAT family N-acetyltransferase n=1 Tax=Aquimarina pacifica TaxID=1296415 RepID=UPI0004707700|nr:GNAT family N-acetyltransferase [Aquimarina pacifica]
MQNPELNFIRLNIEDLNELIKISITTYKNSFSKVNTYENMQSYLDSSFDRDKLCKELNDTNSEFYFSKFNEETTGYFKINFGTSQTDLRETTGMELERIYIVEKFQGKKNGQAIMNYILEIARNRNIKYVWLGVWEKNTEAIRFYKKNGFRIVGNHPFKMGNEIQKDYIMKRTI